jgi:hypothetical protein
MNKEGLIDEKTGKSHYFNKYLKEKTQTLEEESKN